MLRKIFVITSILFATAAVAEIPLATGWYAEGNLGASRASNVTYTVGNSVSSSGKGWNINGGYKFIPYFAAELGYTNYADTTAKVNGNKVANDSHHSYDITTKGILPIGTTGAELFAKVGVARINSNVHNTSYAVANNIPVKTGTHNATGLYFGLGAEYYFTSNIALHGQWQRAKGNNQTGNLDLYSVGLGYLFG